MQCSVNKSSVKYILDKSVSVNQSLKYVLYTRVSITPQSNTLDKAISVNQSVKYLFYSAMSINPQSNTY